MPAVPEGLPLAHAEGCRRDSATRSSLCEAFPRAWGHLSSPPSSSALCASFCSYPFLRTTVGLGVCLPTPMPSSPSTRTGSPRPAPCPHARGLAQRKNPIDACWTNEQTMEMDESPPGPLGGGELGSCHPGLPPDPQAPRCSPRWRGTLCS